MIMSNQFAIAEFDFGRSIDIDLKLNWIEIPRKTEASMY